jgi:methylated-DNA-[protein]-cysteine S-methyltransferase
MLLAARGSALIGAWFEGQKDYPVTSSWQGVKHHPVLDDAKSQLAAYFKGQRDRFELQTAFAWGTPFQHAVWSALLDIGHGQTCSYGDIANAIGKPQAVRAVGGAIGMNPISVIVPCHRVMGRNGSLTGYSGGIERKRTLLLLEQQGRKALA